MENNYQEFDMNKFNDFTKMIKAGSPVHKINFTLECPNAVVGMYLITMGDNTELYLDKMADYTDLNDDTLLVFESRHVVECCQIIYGCLNILKNVNMYRMDYKVFIDQIIDTLLSRPIFYKKMIKELEYITHSCIDINTDRVENPTLVHRKFLHIMKNIWFVPYGKIDEMAKSAIEEFEKYTKVGENNE